MRTDELDYDLPRELIAQQPSPGRSDSRLLVLDRATGAVTDRLFGDIVEYVRAGDCVVINDTRVLPARFFARRLTGALIEGLFLSLRAPRHWEVMLRNAGKLRAQELIAIVDHEGAAWMAARVVERLDATRWVLAVDSDRSCQDILAEVGFAPLPPYIKRRGGADPGRDREDIERYQTVYADNPGAIAAPTAGLHFTHELLKAIEAGGATVGRVTLHVGAGTFLPVSAEQMEEHEIHAEQYSLDAANAERINAVLAGGGRVIAVGTTSVRTLETTARNGRVEAGSGSTRLFITPGHRFQAVGAMVTNFHLPRTTLLALVAAFAGLDKTLAAYRHAVKQRYRFYSYGDAMLIL